MFIKSKLIMIAHSLAKFYIKYILSILNLAYNSISYRLVPDGEKKNKFIPEYIWYNNFLCSLKNNFPKWVKLSSGKKQGSIKF